MVEEDTKFEDPTQERIAIIPKSSVEITRNAKGEPQWKIKIIPGEEKLLDGLMKQAVIIYRALEGEFK